MCGCVCVYLRKKKMGEEKFETKFILHREEREKKGEKCEINKIIVYTVTVTVYICIVTIANV